MVGSACFWRETAYLLESWKLATSCTNKVQQRVDIHTNANNSSLTPNSKLNLHTAAIRWPVEHREQAGR
jgi:hypothetical protein